MPDIDREIIVTALAEGETAGRLAQRLGLSLKQVEGAMREAIADMTNAETLRQEWFLEDHRLRELGLKFYLIAMRNDDPQSAVVYLKASERRASLGGANAPTNYVIHAVNQAPAQDSRSSTQQMLDVLDRIAGVGDRERQLRDRDDLSEDERAELVSLEDAREEKRREKYQAERQRRLGLK